MEEGIREKFAKFKKPEVKKQVDIKKGMKLMALNPAEQEEYLTYTPLCPEVINFEKLKQSNNFGIKLYKDS